MCVCILVILDNNAARQEMSGDAFSFVICTYEKNSSEENQFSILRSNKPSKLFLTVMRPGCFKLGSALSEQERDSAYNSKTFPSN